MIEMNSIMEIIKEFANTGDGSVSSHLRTQTQKETLPKNYILPPSDEGAGCRWQPLNEV